MTYTKVEKYEYMFGLMSLGEIEALFNIDDDSKFDIELDSSGFPRFEGQAGGALSRISLIEMIGITLPTNYYKRVLRFTFGARFSPNFTSNLKVNLYANGIATTYVGLNFVSGNTYLELWIDNVKVDYASFITNTDAPRVYELILSIMRSGSNEIVQPLLMIGNAPAQGLDPYKHTSTNKFSDQTIFSLFNVNMANNEYILLHSLAGVTY